MSTQSLLPDNRTVLEAALEKSLSEQLAKIESPFSTLWDSQNIPNHLLPYLAHAKGVPDWGDDTEQAKRDIVANIWPVQRQAGTKKAVKQAVDALGFDTDVKRGDQPYHLQVDLWREDIGSFEQDIYSRVERRIAQAKSERDVVSININLKTSSSVSVSSFSLAADRIEVRPYSINQIESKGASRVALQLVLTDDIAIYPEVT
jgi:phage tail P2-like protein